MKSVASSRRARASACRVSPAGSRNGHVAPRKLCAAGRVRSVGSSRSGGRPASCRRQKEISSLQDVAVQPGALPDREVRVLHRQLRQGRRSPLDNRRIERRDLPNQEPQGPAVAGDVVQGQRNDVVLVGEAQQQAAQKWTAGEVERLGWPLRGSG